MPRRIESPNPEADYDENEESSDSEEDVVEEGLFGEELPDEDMTQMREEGERIIRSIQQRPPAVRAIGEALERNALYAPETQEQEDVLPVRFFSVEPATRYGEAETVDRTELRAVLKEALEHGDLVEIGDQLLEAETRLIVSRIREFIPHSVAMLRREAVVLVARINEAILKSAIQGTIARDCTTPSSPTATEMARLAGLGSIPIIYWQCLATRRGRSPNADQYLQIC